MKPTNIKTDDLYALYCNGARVGSIAQLKAAKLFAKTLATDQEKEVIIVDNYTGEILYQFIVKRHIEIIEVEP